MDTLQVLPTQAVNKTNALTVLGTSALVDLTQTRVSTLYTVPTGYTAYIKSFDFDGTLDTYSSGFAGSIGTDSPDYTNYNTWGTPSTVFSTGKVSFGAGGGVNSFTAYYKATSGSVIKINVTTGATATALAGTFTAIGYLVAN